MRKGYIKTDGKYRGVGCTDGDYIGPTAWIEYDDTWLHIVTDDYEGHAMLNIETLPYLRRALAQIAKEIKEAAHSRTATPSRLVTPQDTADPTGAAE